MPNLLASINDFLAYCKTEKSLSEKTLYAYRTDLLQLHTFLADSGFTDDIAAISKVELRAFITAISHLKPKSIKRKIAAIKAMFRHLEFEDHIVVTPFRKMRISIKDPRRLPAVMDVEEVTLLFRKAYGTFYAQHDKACWAYRHSLLRVVVFELLFATGGRVSEIAGLRSKAVNLESGHITIIGKGNKERLIQVCNPDSISILKKYIALFHDDIQRTGYFLTNRFHEKLSDQSIRQMVKDTASLCGFSRRITPHCFRHSFATLLLEQDVDIKYIQEMLGHSTISITQIYTHVNSVKQRKILDEKHPRNGMVVRGW